VWVCWLSALAGEEVARRSVSAIVGFASSGCPAVHGGRHGRPRGCWSGAGSPGPEHGGGEGNCREGCLIACEFAGAVPGGRWVVDDDDGGADFASIRATVDVAGDGDTIEVRAMA